MGMMESSSLLPVTKFNLGNTHLDEIIHANDSRMSDLADPLNYLSIKYFATDW